MIVSGVAAWPFVTRPRAARDNMPAVYTLDLLLDIETAKKLKGLGLKIDKVKEDIPGIEDSKGKPFLRLKRKVKLADGTELGPPEVVDAAVKPYSGIVGNGSKVNVIFKAREWKSPLGSGVSADLYKVQITELVEYKGSSEAGVESFEAVGEGIKEKPITESLASDDDDIDEFF